MDYHRWAAPRTVHREDRWRCDRGQATIAMVGVLVIIGFCVIALGWLGEAIVHRATARTAADAIALATADDPAQGSQLAQWYQTRGVVIEQREDHTFAASGPSQAVAWAGTKQAGARAAPLFAAIVARAEQLTQRPLASARWHGSAVRMNPTDAATFGAIAHEFGLCRASESASASRAETFVWC